jgi:hypothetical protein
MPPRSIASISAIVPAVLAAGVFFGALAHGQSSGPFAVLTGAWSGSGSLALSTGSNERIRCRAKYEVADAGSSVRLELRCASDSYKFQLQSDIVSRNGEVQGNWNETTRRVAGRVTGTADSAHINVRVESQQFAALLTLATSGDRQSISIKAPAGSEMSAATITLNRGS